METERENKKNTARTVKIVVLAVLLISIAATVALSLLHSSGKNEEEPPEIITEVTLEKVLDVSELSTFEAIYNGVSTVMNEKKPEKVDYHVCYEARVKMGIDLEKVEIFVDNTAKQIKITLPEVKVTDTVVDIGSLEYIFVSKKANTATVSEQAYKACIADVSQESQEAEDIYILARQNAENIVSALVDPFVKQLDPDYTVEIGWEGEA